MIEISGFILGEYVNFEFESNRSCHVVLRKIEDWLDTTEISGCPEGCDLCNFIEKQ